MKLPRAALILIAALLVLTASLLAANRAAPTAPTATPGGQSAGVGPPPHRTLWRHAPTGQYYAPRPPPLPRPGGGLLIAAASRPDGPSTHLDAYNQDGQLDWTIRVTSTITTLVKSSPPDLERYSTPQRYVFGSVDPGAGLLAVDDAGHTRWRLDTGAPVLGLTALDTEIAARLSGDEVWVINPNGVVRARHHSADRLLVGPVAINSSLFAIGAAPDRVLGLGIMAGAEVWRHDPTRPTLSGLAPDGDGAIAIFEDRLLALTSSGGERWRWTTPGARFGQVAALETDPLARAGAFGDLVVTPAGYDVLAQTSDGLSVYRLDPAGREQWRATLPGRLADAQLYPAGGGAAYVQVARTITWISTCGIATPIRLPGAPPIDAFLPTADRTYIAVDDVLYATAGAAWGPPCP